VNLAAADTHLTGWIAALVGRRDDRVYIARQRIWFVPELDAHRGSLRAWRVIDLPSDARTARREVGKMRPIIKHLVPPDQLARGRRQ
jgi:hypothetical protein